MEYYKIISWVCFVFCLALAAIGILSYFREKTYLKHITLRYLMYFIIMVYVFGFYSMWSDIFFRLYLYNSEDQGAYLPVLSGFISLIGIPFLIVGVVMLVLWATSLLEGKMRKTWLAGMIMATLVIVLSYLFYQQFALLMKVRQIYALFFGASVLFIVLLLGISKTQYLQGQKKLLALALLVSAAGVHTLLFLNIQPLPFVELAFVFLFFLTNTCFAVYFVYLVPELKFATAPENTAPMPSIEEFKAEFSITPREADVVLEIFKGKTNKEIAETLFVTTQTIKDHTHRIYQKTNVRNRTQLASLLRKYKHS